MNLSMVVSSLGAGGAERVAAILSKNFVAVGHKVTVITYTDPATDFHELSPSVVRISLNLEANSDRLLGSVWNNVQSIIALREALDRSQPDLVISFMPTANVWSIVALIGKSIPVIVTEHADPRAFSRGRAWNLMRRITYPKANQLVSVSQGVDARFSWMPHRKRSVINNPVDINNVAGEGLMPAIGWPAGPVVVAMGRLIPEKGFDLLISAFAHAQSMCPAWSLIILGEGQQRSQLESMIESLGLADQVSLPGSFRSPFPILLRGDIFVLSSRTEGFGNALIEAMACGLPAISFDCPSGPREIIRDGVDGLLVSPEDVSGLSEAMIQLMEDTTFRSRLASRAVEVTERFGVEMIMTQWMNLLAEILNDPPMVNNVES